MHDSPVKVLLVDDDEDDFVVTRDLLMDSDRGAFNLTWKSNYEDALAAMQAQRFEVCLVDYRLGKQTGLELLSAARLQGVTAPIILLTGQGDREVDFKAMKAGAADYLVKSQLTSSLLERSIRYAIKDGQTLAALRASEERYALAALGANDGLWDWDLRGDETYFSSRWKSMLGYAEEEIGNSCEDWFSRVHPEDCESLKRELTAHLEGHTPHFQHEHRMLHQDGNYSWILSRGIAVRDLSGKASRMVGSQTDITDRRQAEEKLVYDAFHDGLTGLPNRQAFMERLRRSLDRVRLGSDYVFAVLFLDLDRFKIINDSLGHQLGDKLLVEMARRLELSLRPSDMVARLGGDEFVILLDHLDEASDAAYIAERILKLLAASFTLDEREVFTTASIGITLSSAFSNSAEDLLRDADTAMYRAKGKGKARFEIFDPLMREHAIQLMQMETDMRHALSNQEFILHYQPIISFQSGRLTGFESLIRWNHPENGVIYPGEFIPLAEDNGLINPIGRWVLYESCRQLQVWQTQYPQYPPLTINVNISARQFSQLNLIEEIAATLQDTGLSASSLKLEITESVIMENAELAAKMLNELKALGSHLAIDDFGTGYSSFSHLHKFPIDTLKIDRAFVSRMDTSSDSAEIVRTILMLAHNLKMEVVAEGVETSAQVKQLKELGCDFGQGYFINRPMDAQSATKLLAEEALMSQHSLIPAMELAVPQSL